MTATTHPIDFAKQTRSIFGSPQLSLPPVLVYIGHIKQRDGFFGMYRGLVPKLVTLGASAVVSDQFAQYRPKCE